MVENETSGGYSMAFEIEALTAKQREQFAVKQIPDPLSPVLGILKPREWIIDAGKDVFLFAIGITRMRSCSFFTGKIKR